MPDSIQRIIVGAPPQVMKDFQKVAKGADVRSGFGSFRNCFMTGAEPCKTMSSIATFNRMDDR
jgi:hypothetical protein